MLKSGNLPRKNMNDFISTTPDKKQAVYGFTGSTSGVGAMYGATNSGTCLVIENVYGVSLKGINDLETEVLIPPQSRFRLKKIDKQSDPKGGYGGVGMDTVFAEMENPEVYKHKLYEMCSLQAPKGDSGGSSGKNPGAGNTSCLPQVIQDNLCLSISCLVAVILMVLAAIFKPWELLQPKDDRGVSGIWTQKKLLLIGLIVVIGVSYLGWRYFQGEDFDDEPVSPGKPSRSLYSRKPPRRGSPKNNGKSDYTMIIVVAVIAVVIICGGAAAYCLMCGDSDDELDDCPA